MRKEREAINFSRDLNNLGPIGLLTVQMDFLFAQENIPTKEPVLRKQINSDGESNMGSVSANKARGFHVLRPASLFSESCTIIARAHSIKHRLIHVSLHKPTRCDLVTQRLPRNVTLSETQFVTRGQLLIGRTSGFIV